MFTSNRATTTTTSATIPTTNASNGKSGDVFDDFFGGSGDTTKNDSASTNPWNSTASAKSSVPVGVRKTPESFLGENSSLVNLENLIPSNRPKSTNPFGGANPQGTGMAQSSSLSHGLSTSSSAGQLNNPFMATASNSSQPVVSKPNYNVSLGPTQPPQTPLIFPTMFPSGPAVQPQIMGGMASFPVLPNQGSFVPMMAPLAPANSSATAVALPFGQLNTQTQNGANNSSTNPFLMM